MSQISPPIRILLVVAVAFMAAWTLFLRPSTEAVAPAAETPPPAVNAGGPEAGTAPGKLVEQANEAAAARNAEAEAAADGITGDTAGGPAAPAVTGATRAPAAPVAGEPGQQTRTDADGLPVRVTRAMADAKVVVLLFWAPRSADDRAVRKAFTGIDRHKGKVLAHATHIKRISAYQAVTRGAEVKQSPTIVVVDRKREVQTLVGYVDRTSIDQAVSDALRTKRQ